MQRSPAHGRALRANRLQLFAKEPQEPNDRAVRDGVLKEQRAVQVHVGAEESIQESFGERGLRFVHWHVCFIAPKTENHCEIILQGCKVNSDAFSVDQYCHLVVNLH